MSDQPAARPSGPFFTNWGPRGSELLLKRDAGHALGLHDAPACDGQPIGIAFRWIPSRKGPVATFRLQVGKVELEGEWICRGRRFLRIGEAAEQV